MSFDLGEWDLSKVPGSRITEAITAHAPLLLKRTGVGPDSAAAFLLA